MIKAPGWCSHAVPTLRGWKHPRTSEILKKRSISQAEIDEWYAAQDGVAPAPEPVADPVEEVTEAPTLEALSKVELEELGREHGIELDRRKRKSALVETLKGVIPSK